ncbi:MAG: phosphoglycerate dehydrogenase [Actinobacteria bacterium]|jgi:D-3-phosphoglycerate dehydrogenase|nr:phosphoglycerate dehydrogenase [Actinomycetota bacterium]MCL6095480.1 phosphoglycerate dehydrogenase [Actinomycetota bacterium]
MARILVTEKLAESGLALMRDKGHEVVVSLGLDPESLIEAAREANAIIIRSATKITAQVLEAALHLVVVGRAGIGLDNVDLEAATARGVMVVNAPESNIISAAEHTIGLMIAQARNIPQAHASVISGVWDRSKWEGVELFGKTLGIVGFGRVGALVASRAQAFGMRTIAHDPYVSGERAKRLGVEMVTLEELVAQADFITIHLPKTPETMGLFGKELLDKAKPGMRIINAARGGVIDEEALAEGIAAGRIGGAALDVFAKEPCTSSPLFELPSVVVTPHLGASTREAQDKAGMTIAEQVLLALDGQYVPFAVNLPVRQVPEEAKPFLPLAEQLGRIFASLCEGIPDGLEIEYQGALSAADTGMLTLAVLKGVFTAGSEEPVSYVNAPKLAEERGLDVRESKTSTTHDFVNLISLRSKDHAVAGTLTGARGEPRLVMVDDHTVELPPATNMLVIRNDDRPGMIGVVGTVIGNAGISISSMAVGPSLTGNTALMVLSTDRPIGRDLLDTLRRAEGILDAHAVTS